jgi:hypothetical protein
MLFIDDELRTLDELSSTITSLDDSMVISELEEDFALLLEDFGLLLDDFAELDEDF